MVTQTDPPDPPTGMSGATTMVPPTSTCWSPARCPRRKLSPTTCATYASRGRAITSCGVPSWTSLPASMKTSRAASDGASGGSCGTRMVTHDPLDALSLADRLVFIEAGKLVQEGTPQEVIARPRDAYVAQVVGLNFLRGQRAGDQQVDVGGTIVVAPDIPPGGSGGSVCVTIPPSAATGPAPTAPRATPGRSPSATSSSSARRQG